MNLNVSKVEVLIIKGQSDLIKLTLADTPPAFSFFPNEPVCTMLYVEDGKGIEWARAVFPNSEIIITHLDRTTEMLICHELDP